MKQHKKPCKTCPFAATCPPGETGGSPVSTFIGQSFGPFRIPCHERIDYSDPDWKSACLTDDAPQCAGNAIFRNKVGVAELLPDPLLKLEPFVGDAVFDEPARLFSHHTEVSLELSRLLLTNRAIRLLVANEMRKPEVRTLKEL